MKCGVINICNVIKELLIASQHVLGSSTRFVTNHLVQFLINSSNKRFLNHRQSA